MEGTGESDLAPGEAVGLDPINVVAVVVTRNPGPALDDTLASLLAQDQPNLSILVLDDGSDVPVFDRVAAVAPGAFVRRFDSPRGYGAAANAVTEMVEGASHFLFCHDDVALAPDAVRLLATSALSFSAAVAAPKVVGWDDHERFLSLGYGIDRVGNPVSLVGLDELDQGQHDQLREVTAAHGAVLLIATGTFKAIGGYLTSLTDPAAGTTRGSGVAPGPDLGEDLDLCLRTRRSGGRVIIVPAARVAHQSLVHGLSDPVEAPSLSRSVSGSREAAPIAEQRLLRDRNRIRSVVAIATGTQLVLVLPLLFLQALGRGAPPANALSGRRSRFSTLYLALGRRTVRRAANAQAKRSATADIGSEFVPVSRRFRTNIRSDVTADTARLWRIAERALGSRRGGRLAIGSFVLAVVVVGFGSRGLLGSGVGRAGQIVPLPPVGDLWRLVFSGWHEPALGRFGVIDPGIALVALASSLAFGATGVVSTLVAVAPLLLGAIGMWRSVRHGSIDDGRAGVAIAAAVTYLLAPIPFDALASGNRAALWGYALFPWAMRSLDRVFDACGKTKGSLNTEATSRPARWTVRPALGGAPTLRLAMLLAVGFAMGPANAIVWVQTIVLLGVAVALVSGWRVAGVVVGHALAAFIGALLLVFPLTVRLLGGRLSGWSLIGDDTSRTTHLRVDELLRLHSSTHGAIGPALFGGFFVIAAVFPLLVADGARLLLAIRCWVLIVGSVLLVWSASRGWVPVSLPGPALLLLPAAYGICRAVAEGLGALVNEVRRRGFGWRQGFASVALLSVALSSLPVIAASANGRWTRPLRAPVDKLSWMRGRDDGGFRVAFIGDPRVLPGTAYPLAPSLGLTISRDGLPTIDDQWPVVETPRLVAFRDALRSARVGATTRLGAELTSLSVRYLVVVERAASGGPRRSSPAELREALLEQIDLRAVDSAPDLTVYENDAWVPTVWSPLTSAAGIERNGVVNTAGASVALLPTPLVIQKNIANASNDDSTGARRLEAQRLRPPNTSYEGEVESDSLLIASVPPNKNWQLRVGRSTFRPIGLRSLIDASGTVRTGTSFSGFSVTGSSTTAKLAPHRPFNVTLQLLFLSALWVLATVVVLRDRRRQRHGALTRSATTRTMTDADPEITDDDFSDDAFGDDEFADPFTSSRRVTAAVPDDLPADGSVSDELWSRFAERRREESDEPGERS